MMTSGAIIISPQVFLIAALYIFEPAYVIFSDSGIAMTFFISTIDVLVKNSEV